MASRSNKESLGAKVRKGYDKAVLATSDAMSAAKASWDYGRKPSAPAPARQAERPAPRKQVDISGRGRRAMYDDVVDKVQK